jgi:PIN domain nuclease of toxin-antitoxin system
METKPVKLARAPIEVHLDVVTDPTTILRLGRQHLVDARLADRLSDLQLVPVLEREAGHTEVAEVLQVDLREVARVFLAIETEVSKVTPLGAICLSVAQVDAHRLEAVSDSDDDLAVRIVILVAERGALLRGLTLGDGASE